jgi:hypothetical protein
MIKCLILIASDFNTSQLYRLASQAPSCSPAGAAPAYHTTFAPATTLLQGSY